jgi:2-phosphosulfolactate phosphatase
MDRLADQTNYVVRFEWGERGLETLAAGGASVFVVVDVLSFSTCVTIAVARGAIVFPCRWQDQRSVAYALEHDAILADLRGETGAEYSASSASLRSVPAGIRLVLPSPDGSELALEAASRGIVVAGALCNRSAVGAFLERHGGPVVVIATGDRGHDGSWFPCIEDIVGAGAIIATLTGRRSPQANAALAAYSNVRGNVRGALERCNCGRELIGKGCARDVETAAEVDASNCVPILRGECFVPG